MNKPIQQILDSVAAAMRDEDVPENLILGAGALAGYGWPTAAAACLRAAHQLTAPRKAEEPRHLPTKAGQFLLSDTAEALSGCFGLNSVNPDARYLAISCGRDSVHEQMGVEIRLIEMTGELPRNREWSIFSLSDGRFVSSISEVVRAGVKP